MKKIFLFIAISIILINCKRGDEFLPSKAKGTVYYQDNIIEGPKNIAPEATIYIADEQDAEPFFTQRKATKEGEYTIDFIPDHSKLFVVGEWKDSRGILFKDFQRYQSSSKKDVVVLPSRVDLVLSPRYPGGKIKVMVKDASMQPVNGVEVYLFVNESLAGSVAAGDPKGFFKKETTNENGIAFFYDLGPKDYYVAGRREKQSFAIQKTTTSVGNNDFTTINPINATISTPASPIQLIITVNDAPNGKPMFGSEVFVFTSREQANTVKGSKKPTGAIATQLTNVNGKASFNALEYDKDYFVIARDSVFDPAIIITPPYQLTQMRAVFSDIQHVKTDTKGTPAKVVDPPLIIPQ